MQNWIQDESSDFSYREVLLSFQTVFSLFTQKVVGKDSSLNEDDKSQHNVVNPPVSLDKESSLSLINDGISLVNTESIAWRAFYLDQKISPKLNFFETCLATDIQTSVDSLANKRLFYQTILKNTYTPQK